MNTAVLAELFGRRKSEASGLRLSRRLTSWRSLVGVQAKSLGCEERKLILFAGLRYLGDTKTGQSVRPLSRVACDILRDQEGDGDLLFPVRKAGNQ
jgi:hypothetical protein